MKRSKGHGGLVAVAAVVLVMVPLIVLGAVGCNSNTTMKPDLVDRVIEGQEMVDGLVEKTYLPDIDPQEILDDPLVRGLVEDGQEILEDPLVQDMVEGGRDVYNQAKEDVGKAYDEFKDDADKVVDRVTEEAGNALDQAGKAIDDLLAP